MIWWLRLVINNLNLILLTIIINYIYVINLITLHINSNDIISHIISNNICGWLGITGWDLWGVSVELFDLAEGAFGGALFIDD